MARVKRGTTTHARHAKVIKAAKGYYGRRKNTFKPLPKPSIRHVNMPIVTGVCASGSFALYGFSGSMLLHACMV